MKMTTVVLLLAISFASGQTQAQTQTARQQTIINVFGRLQLSEARYDNLNEWTDGFAFYRPFFFDARDLENKHRANGNTIYLVGGTTHEGGFGFSVSLAADGAMTIAETDFNYNRGDRVEYRLINEHPPMLIISDAKTGNPKDVFMLMSNNNLYDLYISDLLHHIAAGVYQDQTGKTVLISAEYSCITSLWNSPDCTPFTFADEYEMPVPIIVSPKNEACKISKTLTGLELIPMKPKHDDDHEWEVDSAQHQTMLIKIGEVWSDLPLEAKPGIHGRFVLASNRVMTKTQLRLYAGMPTRQNLQIMRNEIFARHGYRFKTPEMAAYFGAKSWYTSQYDDVTGRLTEIERINIALIQELEKE